MTEAYAASLIRIKEMLREAQIRKQGAPVRSEKTKCVVQ